MRIFFDTNVILDLLADRPSFADESAGADVIVTRDPSGFVGAKIRVMSPSEFLEYIQSV